MFSPPLPPAPASSPIKTSMRGTERCQTHVETYVVILRLGGPIWEIKRSDHVSGGSLVLDMSRSRIKKIQFILQFSPENAIAHLRSSTFSNTQRKSGIRKTDPIRLSALSSGRRRRNRSVSKAAGRKPKGPPNEAGRRLEEAWADSRFMQQL